MTIKNASFTVFGTIQYDDEEFEDAFEALDDALFGSDFDVDGIDVTGED